MPFAPRRKATVNLRYDIRMPNRSVDAFVTGTLNYASDMVTNIDQNPINYVQPTTYLHAGFGLREKSGRYTLSLRVNNLTDKRYMSNRSVQLGNFNAMAPNPPATVQTTTWTPPRNAFRNIAVKLDVNF